MVAVAPKTEVKAEVATPVALSAAPKRPAGTRKPDAAPACKK